MKWITKDQRFNNFIKYRPVEPKITQRVFTKFLWIPMEVKGEVRWLVKAHWYEEWKTWVNIEWWEKMGWVENHELENLKDWVNGKTNCRTWDYKE